MRQGPVRRSVRRDVPPDLTARKRAHLVELAKRWHAARDAYLDRLAGPDDLVAVIQRPRALRERQRHEGWAKEAMPVHYHQSAFLSAAAQVKTNWLSTLGRIRWRMCRRSDLSEAQKRWVRVVTKRPSLVQLCLLGRDLVLDESWAAALDQERETRRLRRMLRGAYTAPRPLRRRNWFVADGRQYKPFAKSPDRHYRGAWLSITSLTIGSRLCVPLRGHGFAEFAAHAGTQERPEIRIDIGERVVIRVARHVVPEKRERGLHAGLDKGHDTLLTLSFGDPEEPRSYGVGVGSKVSERTVTAEDALRHRRRLAAYERSLRNSVPEKARRIRRANLRRIKRSRSSARTACGFRDLINGGLNAMFRQQPELAVLHVESLHFGHSDRGRAFNRRLRRWMKGFLQERLRYKAELNGVELNVVNAAYTSQTCPRCGFTSSKNRHAAKFKCGLCGYAGSADAVAATNILRRGSDTAVTRFMPSGEVKQILEERWRAALNGGAWGSNGVALGTDVTEITAAAGAANNCVRSPSVLGSNEQSTWTGLEHNHLRAARTCEPVPRGPVE